MDLEMNFTSSKDIQDSFETIFNDIKIKEEYKTIIKAKMLRIMEAAKYFIVEFDQNPDEWKHFALNFDVYTHFTSPIRRYPDVLLHRLLEKTLAHQYPEEKERGYYDKMCMVASRREKEASDAERGSIKYKQVEYMSYRIGQTFDGMVSGVSEWGIYVEEKTSKCEGMIRLRDLGNDFFVHDEKNSRVFGERSGVEYKIGTPLRIKVKQANLEMRVFELSNTLQIKSLLFFLAYSPDN